MARILYAIMGDARGHLSRSLSVVQQMPDHDYLFAGGGKVLELRNEGHRVYELPMLGTFYKDTRADIAATLSNAARLLLGKKKTIRNCIKEIEKFRPDLIISDYEFFVPLAAKKMGLPCISLDHQHILTHCDYAIPEGKLMDRLLTFFPIKCLYSNASKFIISSFFQLPVKDASVASVVPPILRKRVLQFTPGEGDHGLVYTSGGTFHALLPELEKMDRTFHVYGFGEHPPRKNLIFKPFSQNGFLEDLSTARYVVSNAGHNLISEALYLGKPVVCLPIQLMYEQFFNAYNLKKLGFGDYVLNFSQLLPTLKEMERNAPVYEERIRQFNFWGNKLVVEKLEQELAHQRL